MPTQSSSSLSIFRLLQGISLALLALLSISSSALAAPHGLGNTFEDLQARGKCPTVEQMRVTISTWKSAHMGRKVAFYTSPADEDKVRLDPLYKKGDIVIFGDIFPPAVRQKMRDECGSDKAARWQVALVISKALAWEAFDEAIVFKEGTIRADSVWNTLELPILQQNVVVKKITEYDIITKKKTDVLKRKRPAPESAPKSKSSSPKPAVAKPKGKK